MKLIVLGATGGTGLEIVRRGIEQGHSVIAFVRSPERLNPFGDQITIKQGDLLNSAELEKVIQGHDAVVSGFAPRVPISNGDANLLQRFAMGLTRAMRHAGVKRVVAESVAFLFKDSIVPPTYLFGRLFYPGVVADSSAIITRDSHLFVSRITGGDSGRFRISFETKARRLFLKNPSSASPPAGKSVRTDHQS